MVESWQQVQSSRNAGEVQQLCQYHTGKNPDCLPCGDAKRVETKKATAEWIQAQTLKHFEVIDPATGKAREASKAAVKICDTFAARVKETLELDPAVTLDDIKA